MSTLHAYASTLIWEWNFEVQSGKLTYFQVTHAYTQVLENLGVELRGQVWHVSKSFDLLSNLQIDDKHTFHIIKEIKSFTETSN